MESGITQLRRYANRRAPHEYEGAENYSGTASSWLAPTAIKPPWAPLAPRLSII